MTGNSFPCNACGLCCKRISEIEELKDYDRGDGVCIHLDEDHLCSIYEKRPMICRIDTMYDNVYHQHFSKEEYYLQNALACQSLQEEAGLRKEDQIDLKSLLGGVK